MADLSDLRRRVVERGVEIVERAGDTLERQLRDAAGPGLPPEALTRGPVVVEEPIVSVTLRTEAAITTWVWSHNHQPPNDFEPHLVLDGLTFDENDWRDVLAKDPGDFPYGDDVWFPGQIDGCLCTVEILAGDLIFDPATIDASPQVISAFGQDVLVVPAAPERSDEAPSWFAEGATADGWSGALQGD